MGISRGRAAVHRGREPVLTHGADGDADGVGDLHALAGIEAVPAQVGIGCRLHR
jgi:hypothetical protein